MAAEKREYQKAIDYLYGQMKTGELKIGARLPTERSIAETLQISRNSTREALRILENNGILESRRGSGNYLVGNLGKPISSSIEMMLLLQQTNREEISFFRRNMEKAICRTILENKTFSRWKEPLFGLLMERQDDVQTEQDKQFHYLLIHATENRFWITLLEAIADVYRQWIDIALQTTNRVVKSQLHTAHCAILEALDANDMERCEKAIDLHYDLVDKALQDGKCATEIRFS